MSGPTFRDWPKLGQVMPQPAERFPCKCGYSTTDPKAFWEHVNDKELLLRDGLLAHIERGVYWYPEGPSTTPPSQHNVMQPRQPQKVPDWLDDFVRDTMILCLGLVVFLGGLMALIIWLASP